MKLSYYSYPYWKLDVKCVFIDRNCQEFLTKSDIACRADVSDHEKSYFEWRKHRAYTTIYQSIDRNFQIVIAQRESGKGAWDILKLNFEQASRTQLAGLVDEFSELKLNWQEETIGLFCKRIEVKKAQIKDSHFDMNELLV